MSVRLRLAFLALLFAVPVLAQAQSTTVSGQVTDAGGQSWNNGTLTAQFVPNPQFPTISSYTWTGGTLNQTISGALNGTGGYSALSIPSNNAITPQGSHWQFTFCPQATFPCFTTVLITITGGTQTVNATPPVIAIALTNPPGPFTQAYADSEIISTPLGGQYYNVTLSQARTCTAVSGNSCSVWSSPSGSLPSGGSTGQTVVNTAPGAGTWQNYSFANLASFPAGCGANLFITAISAAPTCTQPAVSNLSGLPVTAPQGGTGVASPTAHSDPEAEGAANYNYVNAGAAVTGAVKTATNGADPGYIVPGLNPSPDVSTTPYPVRCDSATATLDRVQTVRFVSGASVATFPDIGTSGCGSGFVTTLIAQVAVTVNRTTSSTFDVYNGSVSTGQTTFSLPAGQHATISPSASGSSWIVRIAAGGITGLTTNTIPKATSANSLGNSSITDDGTTVTSTDTGGMKAPTFTSTGTTAGFVDYPQGSSSAAVAPCNTATSICEEAPGAVTSYLVLKPGVAAQGALTNIVTAAVDTQGFSGDANHSTTVTIGSGTSIGSTQLCSTANCPVGTYRVNAYVDITTACTTTGTYIINLIYTDDQASKTIPINIQGTGTTPATGSLALSAVGNFGQASQILRSTGAASINYSTTAGACGSGGPMVGKLYLSVEPVQ
jgi:hypothetical protein